MRNPVAGLVAASIVALGMAAGPALAGGGLKDDHPVRSVSWTGFYIGLNAGLADGPVDWTFTGFPRSDHDASGKFAGGQVGYNHQMGSIVLGVEADYMWADIDGDAPCPNPAFACGTTVRGLGSVRGRIGTTALAPGFLLYATGGWGWANVKYEAVPNSPGGFANTVDLSGWVVGGGVEAELGHRMSIKFEYVGYMFGDERHSAAPLPATLDADPTIHTFKVGLNYRF